MKIVSSEVPFDVLNADGDRKAFAVRAGLATDGVLGEASVILDSCQILMGNLADGEGQRLGSALYGIERMIAMAKARIDSVGLESDAALKGNSPL